LILKKISVSLFDSLIEGVLMMVTISYIIPTYNHSGFLKRCLSSILPQLDEGDKIIVVDDGSTDGTYEFVSTHYPTEQLLIVRQKNAGAGAARNKGIALSDTDFLWFIDSDDFILEGSSKKAKNIIRKNGYDLLFFDYVIKENNKERVKSLNVNPESKSELLLTEHFSWNKLISRDLFAAVKYPEGKIRYQDHGTIPLIISRAENIGYAKDTYYYYDFNHPDNISKQKEKNDDMYAAFDNLIRYHDQGHLQKKEMDLLFIQTLIFTQLFNTPSLKFKDVYLNSTKVKNYLMTYFPTWRDSPYLTVGFIKPHAHIIENLRIKVLVGILFKKNTFIPSVLIYSLKIANDIEKK